MMGLVESSPHYLEILRMLLDGVSSRNIEKYLFDEYGEKISYGTISAFKKNNLDIADLIQQVELQQKMIKNGKVSLVNDKVAETETAENMIIKEINTGIDVLNLIRNGLDIADNKDLFEQFFNSEEVSLKDKISVVISLSKLDLDWRKNTETNINVDSQLLHLTNTFNESVDW